MKRSLALLLAALFSFAVTAQDRPAAEKKTEQKEKKEDARDNISTTSHSIRTGSETIKYTARAGTIVLKNDEGEPRASFFVVAYTKDGADPAKRPVTFTFNGGPGSSSVWLHMGAFGPNAPMCSHTDDEPGPPLNVNVIGRFAGSAPSFA